MLRAIQGVGQINLFGGSEYAIAHLAATRQNSAGST